jgi:hypothetical protein
MIILLAMLLALCLPAVARAEGPAPIPSTQPAQAHRTVERAIGYLQTESAAWLSHGKCAACHHVAMPLWALNEAGRQGYAINRRFVNETAEATLGSLAKMRASGIAANPAAPPDPRPMAKGVNMGAVFMAVAVESLPARNEGQRQSLARIEAEIVRKQHDDGSWDFYLSRPPISESQATDAAWMMMALQGDAAPPAPGACRAAMEKGMAWLERADRADLPQVKTLKLLLLLRAGTPRDRLQTAIDALLALQRSDGGWAQTAKAASDAFATGQALYVLSLAGYTADRPQIRRAIGFLAATQKPDGSWPMTSRATPDGRPGSAKLLSPITCAATAWATLGLARLMPE